MIHHETQNHKEQAALDLVTERDFEELDEFPYAARGIRSGMLGVGAVTRFVDFDTAARMSYQ